MKSENIIIHFGMDKTGSSSIRSSLFKNLADPAFHYVAPGMENASRNLSAGFKENPASFHYYRNLEPNSDEIKQLRLDAIKSLDTELRKAIGKTAIISAEAVSNFKESEFRNLCNFFGVHARIIMAVGYIRRPKEYMESVFQQHVKAGLIKKLSPDSLLSDYRVRFEKFDTVLGRENAKLWIFDPKSFPDGCVVQDFCVRLGVNFSPKDVIRTNEGLSLPALSLLFALCKFGPKYNPGPSFFRENQLLTSHVKKLCGPKLRLHSSLVAPVIKAKRNGISWMEGRLSASLSEDLTAHDEFAIRSEADLLNFPPEALRWLAKQLGSDYVKRWHPKMDPQEVANWMHILRTQLSDKYHNTSRV